MALRKELIGIVGGGFFGCGLGVCLEAKVSKWRFRVGEKGEVGIAFTSYAFC